MISHLLELLLEIKPENPMQFMSEYYIHYAHGSQVSFAAFKHATIPTKYKDWLGASGRAYQILSQDKLLEQKEAIHFFSLFAYEHDQVKLGLSEFTRQSLLHGEPLSFDEFERLLFVHSVTQDLCLMLKQHFKLLQPRRVCYQNQIEKMLVPLMEASKPWNRTKIDIIAMFMKNCDLVDHLTFESAIKIVAKTCELGGL